jgi:hypothetical protein
LVVLLARCAHSRESDFETEKREIKEIEKSDVDDFSADGTSGLPSTPLSIFENSEEDLDALYKHDVVPGSEVPVFDEHSTVKSGFSGVTFLFFSLRLMSSNCCIAGLTSAKACISTRAC